MQKVLSLGTGQFGFVLSPLQTPARVFTGTIDGEQARLGGAPLSPVKGHVVPTSVKLYLVTSRSPARSEPWQGWMLSTQSLRTVLEYVRKLHLFNIRDFLSELI